MTKDKCGGKADSNPVEDGTVAAPATELVLYQSEDGRKIQCRLYEQTMWLPQRLIAELFAVTVPTVNEHIAGILSDGELASEATIRKFRIVQSEGKRSVNREVERAI